MSEVGEDTALVACPTYAGLADCVDEYLKAYREFRYQHRRLLLVDNTRDDGAYAEQLRAKCADIDGATVLHVDPSRDFQETFKRCWQEILKHAQEIDFRWVLSIEQDVICSPMTIDTLLNAAGYVGAPFVTHTYPYHWGVNGLYQGLGCTLMHRDLLAQAMQTVEAEPRGLVEGAIYKVAAGNTHVSMTRVLEIRHLDGQLRYWQYDAETDPRVCEPPEYAALHAQGFISTRLQ